MLRAACILAIVLCSLYAGATAGLAAGIIALLLGATVLGINEAVDRLGHLLYQARKQTALLERIVDHQTTAVHRRTA